MKVNQARRAIIECLTFAMLVFATSEGSFAQATQAKEWKSSVLFINGTAHLGNGESFQKSLVGIRDGKISEVYNANIVDYHNLKYDTIIDLEGKHIYPAFIAPNSSLGLREIDAVRASHDFSESGQVNPNARSIIAYNTDSRIIPTVRSNGILLAQVTPRGGLISGMSSVVELDGWNWEDALFREDDGIHINWPRFTPEDVNANKEKKDTISKEFLRRQQVMVIEKYFADASAYLASSFNYEINLRLEAARGVFDGQKTLYIHADHARELAEIAYFKKNFKIPKVVVVGGGDSWKVPELFVDNNIPIMVRRIHSLPARPDDDIDLSYKLPAMLREKGILFCLENSGEMEAMGVRNLPFLAGTARAYGLKEEEAIRSITLDAAKILGIDKRVGSLEAGKDATLFISKGDALDPITNRVELALIRGRMLDLDNHQEQLYRKYSEKYGQKKGQEE